jgi:hypothetical protein
MTNLHSELDRITGIMPVMGGAFLFPHMLEVGYPLRDP